MTDNAGHEPDAEIQDQDLMERVRSGDQDAFAVLIRRHQQSVLNFFRRLGAYSNAEDLAQETFLRVFRYRFKYKPVAKFTTFLYTLARHAWADGLRKAMRHAAIAERVANELPASDDGAMGRTRAAMDTQMALEKLSEKLRVVVVMSMYQGMKYEEISEILDIPSGTVKSRMFTALNQLKEILDDRSLAKHE
jgi:RNA polymerase sigma-70 factor (ECF subfamily)